jgi:hypothetical protein
MVAGSMGDKPSCFTAIRDLQPPFRPDRRLALHLELTRGPRMKRLLLIALSVAPLLPLAPCGPWWWHHHGGGYDHGSHYEHGGHYEHR